MWLSEITLQQIGFRILGYLLIASVHGAVLSGAAVILGDKGPKFDGRLTVIPTSHMDLAGAISVILFGNGWVKPIAIDARELRMGRVGVCIVILSGFVGLLALAALFHALVIPALVTLSHSAGLAASAFLRFASDLAIWMALLSLVPVPPLVGGLLPGAFGFRVPPKALWLMTALVLLAVGSGLIRQLFGPAQGLIASVILGK